MQTYYIGIGGVARAGKDSIASALKAKLCNIYPSKSIEIIPLSAPLKEDCKDFVKNHLDLDVYTNDTNEKSIFRELLVWYGKVKRQQTNGTYWTNLLDVNAKNKNLDICIIPDIRYQQYEKDEVFWLRSKSKNSFIHIERKLPNGDIQPPANIDEKINDNIIRELADKKIVLDTFLNEEKDSKFSVIADEIFQTLIKPKI
jgi:hypothetical protein